MNKIRLPNIFLLLLFLTNSISVIADSMIIPAPPKIKASSYLVMDFNSGKFLVEENIDQRVPPASLTKIMTSYVVSSELENGKISLEDEVLVSEHE